MKEKNMTFHREELEMLSTLELERILRTELDSDTPERETVLLVLSILEDRDPTDSTNRPEGTMDAWNAIVNCTDCLEPTREKPIPKSRKWFVPLAAAAAIVLILLMTIPQTVGAENIFAMLGRWTRDLFSFSDETKGQDNGNYVFQTNHEGLQQVYDAVVELGITDPVVPSWIPEGYELKELRVVPAEDDAKVYAHFSKEEKYIQFMVESYGVDSTNDYPKDEGNTVLYNVEGIFYYIVSNDTTWKAVWNCNSTECSLVTNEKKEVLYDLLISIHRRNS